MRGAVFVCGILSLIPHLAFGYEFEGLWEIVRKECFENNKPFACETPYHQIEINYNVSGETLCIRYLSKDNAFLEECLNRFDYSRPELGLIFKAELSLSSDGTGALYKMTQSNSMEKTIQGRVIEKNGTGKFSLMEILEIENSVTGTSHRQDEVYFLESGRRLPKAANGLLKGVDFRKSF